jgi:hypothetical protein
VENDKEVTGANLSEAMGIERCAAFLARWPWDNSVERESRTTDVYRKDRSREAVRRALPSDP